MLLPAVLKAYMVAHRIDARAVLADGRLGLGFDGRWRVQLRLVGEGRLLLSALLLDLAGLGETQREGLLVALAGHAAGVLRDHACALALDEDAARLMLQQQLPADLSLSQLEEALGDFVNMLAFWEGSARMEAVRRQAVPTR